MIKKNIEITINSKTRKVTFEDNFIGLNGENLQGNIIFKFDDVFVNGTPRVEVIKGSNKYIISEVEEIDETYVMPIKSSLLTNDEIIMQLVINETGTEIPVFKCKEFYLRVGDSINAQIDIPDEYETWIDIANEKIAEINDAIDETNNLDLDANRVDDGVEVTITKKDGTTKTVEVFDGQGGGGGTSDFDELENRPKYNNQTMTHNTNIPEIPTYTSQLTNNSNFVSDSNYVHTDNNFTTNNKEKLDSLENYDDSEVRSLISNEITNRQNADNNLQSQIDAITSSSDVVDVVGTYAELEDYDTTHLKDNDIVKVLVDESKSNAITYYRWVIVDNIGSWNYIGSQGPFYTKSQSDSIIGNLSDLETTTKTNLVNAINEVANKSVKVDEVTTRLNDDDEVEVTGIYTTQDSARKIWEGTLSQYNALETKDNDTYYYITDDDNVNLTHETWTFTLADDSVVTKEVVLWTSQM